MADTRGLIEHIRMNDHSPVMIVSGALAYARGCGGIGRRVADAAQAAMDAELRKIEAERQTGMRPKRIGERE